MQTLVQPGVMRTLMGQPETAAGPVRGVHRRSSSSLSSEAQTWSVTA